MKFPDGAVERAVRRVMLPPTGRCEFHDAGTGDRCVHRGIALTLQDSLGHYVRRILCGLHSDWVHASPPPKTTERPAT